MRIREVIRRSAAVSGLLCALWLMLPASAAYAAPCGQVSYDDGGPGKSPALPGFPATDPCAKQAHTGTAAVAAGAALAAAAAAAAGIGRGRVPDPAELAAGPEAAAPPPPAAAGIGQAADGNAHCRTGGDPVDVVSGQMITDATDTELPGLLPLLLRRAYASGYPGGRLYGPGWSSTLDQRLEFDTRGIHYFGDDAQTLRYPYPAQPGQSVLPAEGARWPLHWDPDGTIRIEDPHRGLTRHFTAATQPALHLLSALSDRNGHRVTFHRDGDAPVLVEHSAGYRVAIDTATTPAGPRTTGLRLLNGPDDARGTVLRRFDYDDLGRLTAVTDPTGVPFHYVYDQHHRITSWTDRNGFTYGYRYDDSGRVIHGIGPQGHLSATFEYHPLRRCTIVTDSLGGRTEYHYDRHHHITRTVDPLGNSVLTESDRYGRLLAHTDELGHTTRYTLDDHGNPTRIERPDGASLRLRYNELHLLTEVTGPDGASWHYTYDPQGNLRTETDPTGARTTHTYDAFGRPTAITDALGHVQHIHTNPAGLPLAITDPLGHTTHALRDAFGRVTELRDPLGHRTILEWTPSGQLACRTHPDGAVERWHYDAEGNQTVHESAEGAFTATTYGPFGTPTTRTAPDGARYTFAHDTELRLRQVTNPQGLTWTYHYDAAGRPHSETDFDGRTLTYTHDPAGRLTSRTNALGQTITYQYDQLGRLTTKDSDGVLTTYTHDTYGNLHQAAGPDAALTRHHDSLGRLTSETINGRTITHTYDPLGRRTSRTTPTGALSTWAYDPAGRPTSLTTSSHTFTLEHDPLGRETARHFGQGLTLTQTWDLTGRLSTGTLTDPTRTLHHRSHTYRRDGYLTTLTDSATGTRAFDLDRAGRLTAVHAANWTERYAYDPAGNQTEADWPSHHPGSEARGPRAYTGARISHAGSVRYEHDAQGRVILRQRTRPSRKPDTWHYTWDAEDRLTSVTTPDGTRWHYHYDPLGRRTTKQRLSADGELTERTDFTWDGFTLAEQTTTPTTGPGNPVTLTWDHDGLRPIAQTERIALSQHEVDQRFFAIVTDLVGTPTHLIDESGTTAWHSRATLWGTTAWSTDSTAYTPLRFPGQYFDPETGFHYNIHRHYDPETGRYASPDPLGLVPDPSPFAYVHNPHTWMDPLGLASCAKQGWEQKADFSSTRTMSKKYDAHAHDFLNSPGNRNNAALKAFEESMRKHMTARDTKIYRYNYHGQGQAVGFIDPQTLRMVMLHSDGRFWSGWILSDKQFSGIVDKGFLA
ncbi:RHS repeat-associated core domain-containing protein [Streptomyces orinoci]|uniref:RHS repeat-associated core domain-containing protein n=1 Tax=Streptomyces orinoci TaxID=67339 RepID=A0ABV3K4C4_STRON|nr:RHS repeat-associated core domain-containing protein [Streptomyces orinoci]